MRLLINAFRLAVRNKTENDLFGLIHKLEQPKKKGL